MNGRVGHGDQHRSFVRTSAPFRGLTRGSNEHLVDLDVSAEFVRRIALRHRAAHAGEHRPRRLVPQAQFLGEERCREAPLVEGDEKERDEPIQEGGVRPVEDRACRRTIEELASPALVGAAVFQARVEVFLAALEAWHAVRPTNVHEVAFANFFAGEGREEVHEIPRMIPLLHVRMVSAFRTFFCVKRIAI